MKVGLVVSMYDEVATVKKTLELTGAAFEHIVIVQSDLEPHNDLIAMMEICNVYGEYVLLPNLDTRTAEDKEKTDERFDFTNKSLARNFSLGFEACQGHDLDYVVAITGDTLLLHRAGIASIFEAMDGAQVACSRAMGQDFHSAHWSREEMSDPECPKGGRLQDKTNKDFMPHLFIVTGEMIPIMSNIPLTNPWCFEQCLGDVIGDAKQFVFSYTAFGLADFSVSKNGMKVRFIGKDITKTMLSGIIYNVPSEKGWVHGSDRSTTEVENAD